MVEGKVMYLIDSDKEVKASVMCLALKGAWESSATAMWGNGVASSTHAAGWGNRSVSATPTAFVFVTLCLFFSSSLQYNTTSF